MQCDINKTNKFCDISISTEYHNNRSSRKMLLLFPNIFKKYKTFSVLIYSYTVSTRVEIGKTRNCVETRRPQGGVFSHNFEFFQFSFII